MSLTKNYYHDLICEQQHPEFDQYNYDVLAEEEYLKKTLDDKQKTNQSVIALEVAKKLIA